MRIAVFTECYHDLNGVGHTYRKLVEYAERKGLKLDMYIPGHGKVDEKGSVRVIEVMVDIPIEYYPEIFFDAWSVPRHIFDHLPRKVESNFRNENYDVVLLATQGSMGLYALSAARKYKVPLVGSYHTQASTYAEIRMENFLGHPSGPPLSLVPKATKELAVKAETYYYSKTLFNFAPTRMICSMIEERFNRPTEVFRRGVDIESFNPEKGRPRDGRTVLLVSRLSPEKGIDILKGFKERLPDARLVIVGDGPDRKRLEQLIPEAEFKGFMTGEALFEEFASADIFVFPSVTETYGNVVQEAMASGLPVVLDAGGPSSELVRDGVDGFHYKDANDMFQRLFSLVENGTLCTKMSGNARDAMEKMTWDSVFDRLYTDLAKAGMMHRDRPHIQS
ncbi:MAG: glycosyltransferase [Thermoplasmatota archaeon]